MSLPDLGEKLSLSLTNVVNARRAMTEDTSFWSRTMMNTVMSGLRTR